jgi:hypothetical protein
VRTLRASAFGALAGSAVLGSTVWIEALDRGDFTPCWYMLPFAPLLVLATTICTLFGTIIFGLPVMALLRKAGAESLPAYLFAGALAGTLLVMMNGSPYQSEFPYFLAYPMATAAAFWREVRVPALLERMDR